MKFRTEISMEPPSFKLNYEDHCFMMGSCFAEHIGHRMEEMKFHIQVNPFGITYNPVSAAELLGKIIAERKYIESELFYANDRWQHFDFHSRYADVDKIRALEKMNNSISKGADVLKSAKVLFVTFGTSWVYNLKETGEVVNNNHKLPADRFQRSLVDLSDMFELWSSLIKDLTTANPGIQVVFSVSPVRHLKDGMTGNARSKARLIELAHQLCDAFDSATYFPGYEILMDDLRDYRFYDKSLVHPNEIAIDYIWQLFTKTYFTSSTLEEINMVNQVKANLSHKAINTEAKPYQQMLQKSENLIDQLQANHPSLDFSEELKQIAFLNNY